MNKRKKCANTGRIFMSVFIYVNEIWQMPDYLRGRVKKFCLSANKYSWAPKEYKGSERKNCINWRNESKRGIKRKGKR